MIQTQQGPVTSEVGKMYKLGMSEYDVIYTSNHEIMAAYKNMYPECKFVDIDSEDYLEMTKDSDNYKELFVNTFNNG